MKLGGFAPFGLLRLGGGQSRAQAIYRAFREATGGSFQEDGHADGCMFATAMGMARVAMALERAGNQSLPLKVTDMLSAYEEEYGLVPEEGASLWSRRRALAERVRPPEAATRASLERSLKAALGSDFIAYQTLSPAEYLADPQTYPAMPQNGPGLFVPRYKTRKIGRLRAPCVGVKDAGGHWQKVPLLLEPVPGLEESFTFVEGDRVVIGPDNGSHAENKGLAAPLPRPETDESFSFTLSPGVIAAIADALDDDEDAAPPEPEPEPDTPAQTDFGVYATMGHPKGQVVVSQRWPYWIGQAKRARIVVSDRAARDPQIVARVDRIMRERAKATSLWDIVSAVSESGFILTRSTLDITTLG